MSLKYVALIPSYLASDIDVGVPKQTFLLTDWELRNRVPNATGKQSITTLEEMLLNNWQSRE